MQYIPHLLKVSYLLQMKSKGSVSFKNSTVFYHIYGSGKPVVLIHGFGEDGNIWNHLVNQLKKNFRVLVPDLPGSGESTILADQDRQTSIDDYAEVIVYLLKKEDIGKCTVIGHSMGGYIALAIADNYPGLLEGIGLFNSTAFADDEARIKGRLKSIEFLQKNEAAVFLKTSIPGLFAEKFREEHPAEIAALTDSLKYFTSTALIQYSLAMISRPERINVLRSAILPVLFIIGEKDPAIPFEKSLAQCHLPRIAYVHILRNTGHMAMLEKVASCAEIISAYLENVNG